jgi:hypothetical protein
MIKIRVAIYMYTPSVLFHNPSPLYFMTSHLNSLIPSLSPSLSPLPQFAARYF